MSSLEKVGFSETSRFLIEHFQTLEDVLRAEKRLSGELWSLVLSMEMDLQERAWWHHGWLVSRKSAGDFHISKRTWRNGNEYVISICSGGYSPPRVFGSEAPPHLSVWSPPKHKGLIAALAERLDDASTRLPGTKDHGGGGYLVRDTLPKCLPDAIDSYARELKAKALGFFDAYADFLTKHEQRILAAVAAGR